MQDYTAMDSTKLLLASCALATTLPLLAIISWADLTLGVILFAPLALIPHHLFLAFRLHFKATTRVGTVDTLVLHVFAGAYALGTLYALFFYGGAVFGWSRRYDLNILRHAVLAVQLLGALAECGVLGLLTLRARRGDATGDAEHGPLYLPADAPSYGRAPVHGMPSSLDHVPVSSSLHLPSHDIC
jgi:hypothetical protein